MLFTLIIWMYLAFIFLIYGTGTLALIRRSFSPQSPRIPLSMVALLGLAVIAWMSSILSLVIKMGLVAHLFVLVGALLVLFFHFDEVKACLLVGFPRTSRVVWILALLVLVTTILYAVKIPGNPDTPLYHAQAIHWIEEYPAVLGLGNLEPRLGANSSWFTLNALFSFSFLNFQSFHIIPSFLFLVCVAYFLDGLQNLMKGDSGLSQMVKLGFVPLAFYILIDEISSPGTDLPVILFYWVILCLWLEAVEEPSSPILATLILFFSVLVVTFKLSGVLVLLIALQTLMHWVARKEFRFLRTGLGLAAAVLLPWMVRTFILTGYWIYPEPLMQMFSPRVDWQIPIDRVLAFKRGVQAWALSPGTTWDEISGFSLLQRLGFWFSNLTSNQEGITILALLSPILFGLFSAVPKRHAKTISYFSVILLSFLNLLFWLFSAPNFRFGYGFVVGSALLGVAPLIKLVFEKFKNYRMYLLVALTLVLSLQQVYVILGSTRDGTQYPEYVILPADYAHVPTDTCSLEGVTIFCAHRYRQCGYDAFPCVPQIPKDVVLRSNSFRAGFRRNSSDP
jgi:hypothetical protein